MYVCRLEVSTDVRMWEDLGQTTSVEHQDDDINDKATYVGHARIQPPMTRHKCVASHLTFQKASILIQSERVHLSELSAMQSSSAIAMQYMVVHAALVGSPSAIVRASNNCINNASLVGWWLVEWWWVE